jgi:ketosteroid isomerase-like protein
MHEDVEWVNPPDAIETGTRRGQSDFDEAGSAFRRAYSSVQIEVERQVDFGDAVGVIAVVMFQGRGSGIELRQRMGLVFTFGHGRLVRFEWSNDPEGLLSATGLSEANGD